MDSNSDKNSVTRNKLYEWVWSKPITTICNELNISGTDIRQACREYEIPTPTQGHWMKLKHGIPSASIPLPISDNVTIEIRKQSKTEIKNKVKEAGLVYKVSNKLTKPHPLVKNAKKVMSNQHAGFYGKGIDVVYSAGKCLATEVTKSNILRALRLWDALIKLILKRGHKISNDKESEFLIFGEEFTIRVREILKRVKVPDSSWDQTEMVSSGILSFKIHQSYRTYEWRNKKDKPIEDQLLNVLTKLEQLALQKKQERIEREAWHKQYEVEQAIKKAREVKVAAEISEFKKLFETATRWHKSQYLRNYIQEFESYAIKTNSLIKEKQDWIEWAREKADWYDPFVEKEVDLLREVDRDKV